MNLLDAEKEILKYGNEIIDILLYDNTTKHNIIWATDGYEKFGSSYHAYDEMTSLSISSLCFKVIQPRVLKSKEEQKTRTKKRAEVFTPSWMCNLQNNLIDNEWFERKNVFNTEIKNGWVSNIEKITFPNTKGKTWLDYVMLNRMECACGEAPYLTSRYDAATASVIEINDRIGLLDRKLRVVNENTENEKDWIKYAKKAFQSIYGFEYQGDNLLLARENLLFTYIENFIYKFNKSPEYKDIKKIAEIISWNIWQMDGLTFNVPLHDKIQYCDQITIFGIQEFDFECKIKDWHSRKMPIIKFKDYIKGDKNE